MTDDLETLRSRYRVAVHFLDNTRTKSDRNKWLDIISSIRREIHILESIEINQR